MYICAVLNFVCFLLFEFFFCCSSVLFTIYLMYEPTDEQQQPKTQKKTMIYGRNIYLEHSVFFLVFCFWTFICQKKIVTKWVSKRESGGGVREQKAKANKWVFLYSINPCIKRIYCAYFICVLFFWLLPLASLLWHANKKRIEKRSDKGRRGRLNCWGKHTPKKII